MYQIGLIGVGYWGPNIARSFEETQKAKIRWLCDLDPERLELVSKLYPTAHVTQDIEDVLKDPEVDAVAISTPVHTHHSLSLKSLQAKKHVLVEKPITKDSQQALELIEAAKTQQLCLMVGHVFEYNASIRTLKELISSGELGEIYYLHFERTNLGPVRTDVNALWDLASHDISIMCYLLDENPKDVTVRGQDFLNTGWEDVVFATFSFPKGALAHVYVSWLNPRKVRQIVVIGSKQMVIWDDLDLRAQIKVYQKSVQEEERKKVCDSYLAYKTWVVDRGMYVYPVTPNQPLKAECEHFLECLEKGKKPQSDGYSGFRVVKILEAANYSMTHKSTITPIEI